MRNLSRRELECERSGASEKKSRNLYKRQKSDSVMSLNADKNFDYYLSTDLEKYAGKWIAILDNKIPSCASPIPAPRGGVLRLGELRQL